MESYDGAEVCELAGLFMLNELSKKFDKDNIGLYRDDGLTVFKIQIEFILLYIFIFPSTILSLRSKNSSQIAEAI